MVTGAVASAAESSEQRDAKQEKQTEGDEEVLDLPVGERPPTWLEVVCRNGIYCCCWLF